MKFEFSNKTELEKLLAALKDQFTKGMLLIDEPVEEDNLPISELDMPEPVKKFFKDNAVDPYRLLNDLPVPFFIKDSNCGWFYVNKAFCRFFDLNLADIYQKTSHAIFPRNEAELFLAQDRSVMDTGEDSSLEIEISSIKGHNRVILTTKSLFYDVNKTPYIIGTFNEITSFKDMVRSIRQEKNVLESQVIARTELLTATIEKLQDEIGQREKTEQALIQEEDKFRSVIEQAAEGIVLNDNKGRIIEWNDSLTEITGITKEYAIGKYMWDVEFQLMKPEKKSGDFYQTLRNRILETLKNDFIPANIMSLDGEIVRTDGRLRFVNLTSFLIKTSNTVYIGRIIRDITEKKISEIALQRSEAQYRAIFENSSVVILIIDPEKYKILTANIKAAEIYGYPLDQFTGMPMEQLTKDFSHDCLQIDQIINYEETKISETIHISRKGDEINMLVNGSTVDYEGKKAIMNFYRDVTELKQAEKARETVYKISQLTHTIEKTDDLYKSIHKIINDILPARNFYIALYDEVKDTISFPYYVDEKDIPPGSRRLRRGLTEYVLRHGKPILTNQKILQQLEMSGEIEVIGSDTDTWLGAPLISHNKVIGVLAVQSYSEDVKFSEKEKDLLVFVSEQIAHQIYKRQAEEEILRGKAKAEESDRLKTALIANMNHDLRTPMTGILGFSSLLKKQVKDPEMMNMVDTIIESGDKLMSMINSILQLSQLEASQKQIDIVNGDLNKYADMSLQQFETKAKLKNLYIVRQYHDTVFATFNESYLLQILNNLITNAISYTEKGGVTIKTGYTSYEGAEYAFISIADTGIGIAEENFGMIFQEFRQVSEGLNRRYDGSGLGLSLCKKMTEIMSGKINVESSLGKGSVFTVMLPAAQQHGPEKNTAHNEKKPFKPGHLKKIKYKVLVVEDNKINGELLNAILKQDYEVDIAKTGNLAIELVKRGEYDIVLMDINLGTGMTGIQAAKEIHRIKRELPLIAMTAYSTEKEIDQIMKNDFIGFVLKPIDKTSLFKVLDKSIPKKIK